MQSEHVGGNDGGGDPALLNPVCAVLQQLVPLLATLPPPGQRDKPRVSGFRTTFWSSFGCLESGFCVLGYIAQKLATTCISSIQRTLVRKVVQIFEIPRIRAYLPGRIPSETAISDQKNCWGLWVWSWAAASLSGKKHCNGTSCVLKRSVIASCRTKIFGKRFTTFGDTAWNVQKFCVLQK